MINVIAIVKDALIKRGWIDPKETAPSYFYVRDDWEVTLDSEESLLDHLNECGYDKGSKIFIGCLYSLPLREASFKDGKWVIDRKKIVKI